MAMKLYPDTAVQAIANAIRAKNGSSDTYSIGEMAQAITDLPSGGGGGDFDALVDGSITSIESDVTSVRAYVCAGCTSLVSASFPNVTTAKGYMFNGCTSLRSVSLPSVTGFSGTYGFQNVTINSIIFPKATSSPTANYFNGSKIGILVFPRLTRTVTNAINTVTTLTTVDFGETYATMGDYSFNGDTNLNTLILRRKTAPVTLSNVRALSSTKFKNGGAGGTIYIPKVLYDQLGTGTNDYQSATNWSTINGYGTITWAKIEGSQYETHYADGTEIPTE